MRSYILSAAVALASLQLGAAQTYSDCNPTLKSNCPSDPALGKSITVDFTQGASSDFTALSGTTIKYGSNGAEFTINKDGESPTMESAWYIFFGSVEVVIEAAPGQGIVSSVVLESDVLDEIDWEWLGGDDTQVQTNYFGKGDTTTYDRGAFHTVATPQATFHTYTIDWTSSYVKWSIDGAVVRTLNYADAQAGKRFPQTPMRVKLGNWVGGSSSNAPGTIQWAGGLTDFSKAPFTMNVKSIKVTDGTSGTGSYVYTDMTGDYTSIKLDGEAILLATGSSSASAVPATTAAASSSSSAAAGSVAAQSTSAVSTTTVPTVTSSVSLVSSTLSTSTVPATSTTAVIPMSTAVVPAATGSRNGTVSTGAASPSSATSTVLSSGASKYGVADLAVVVLGLGLGYLIM